MAKGMGAPVYQAEGMVGLKIKELTLVSDSFQDKCNQFTKPKAWQLLDFMDRH
jgi:hypothetical protein